MALITRKFTLFTKLQDTANTEKLTKRMQNYEFYLKRSLRIAKNIRVRYGKRLLTPGINAKLHINSLHFHKMQNTNTLNKIPNWFKRDVV